MPAELGQVVHYTREDGSEITAVVARVEDALRDLILFHGHSIDNEEYPSQGGGELVKAINPGTEAGTYHAVEDHADAAPEEPVEPEASEPTQIDGQTVAEAPAPEPPPAPEPAAQPETIGEALRPEGE